MTIQVNEKEYIVPISIISGILKVVNKANKKISKFKDFGQYDDLNQSLIQYEFNALQSKDLDFISKINSNSSKHMLLNHSLYAKISFNMEFPNISDWRVIGEIKPIQGLEDEEYTISSYTDKDLPAKYRNLENPKSCEHCNTDRKRKLTFVIKNTNTAEVLQVGNSCMTDYIDKDSLKSILSISRYFNDIKASLRSEAAAEVYEPSIDLFLKENYLATQLAVLQKLPYIGSANKTSNHEFFKDVPSNVFREKLMSVNSSLNSNIFKFTSGSSSGVKISTHTITMLCMLSELGLIEDNFGIDEIDSFIKSISVGDAHTKSASDLIDWFSSFDHTLFNDGIFNLKQIVTLPTDFITSEECHKIEFASYFNNLVQDSSPKLKLLSSGFDYAVDIGSFKLGDYDKMFDKKDFVTASIAVNNHDSGDFFKSDTEFPSFKKALVLSSALYKELEIESAKEANDKRLLSLINDAANIKIDVDYEKIVDFINSPQMPNGEFNREIRMIVNSDAKNITLSSAKSLAFLGKMYNDQIKKDALYRKIENKNIKISKTIGASGDKFEDIELKYIGSRYADQAYGTVQYMSFVDVIGNQYTYAKSEGTNLPSAFSEALDNGSSWDDLKGKWLNSSFSVKEPKTFRGETQLYVNRLKFASGMCDKPLQSFNPNLKTKHVESDLILMEKHSLENEGDLFFAYKFSNDGEDFYYRTNIDLCINIGEKKSFKYTKSESSNEIFGLNKEAYVKKRKINKKIKA